MQPFYMDFPEIAKSETRAIHVLRSENPGDPPPDSYSLIELYCPDKNCDCRRVLITVLAENQKQPVATINMAFDPENPDSGPFLDPINPQSEFSDYFLDYFVDMINNDHEYLARLYRHYVMVKELVENKPYSGRPFATPGSIIRKPTKATPFPELDQLLDRFQKLAVPAKIGRNAPCPCGSGKKYKKYCLLDPRQPNTGTREGVIDNSAQKNLENHEELINLTKQWQQQDNDQLAQEISDKIAADPLMAFSLLKELPKKHPDNSKNKAEQSQYNAVLFLLEESLVEIRFAIDKRRQWAIDAGAEIQENIAESFFNKMVDVRVQSDIITALSRAKLEIHPRIKQQSEKLAEYYNKFSGPADPGTLDNLMDELVATGTTDVQELYDVIMPEISMLPPEGQVLLIARMSGSTHPIMRDLSSLFLLHSDKNIRSSLPFIIAKEQPLKEITPIILRRMISIRNWLPKDECPALDQAIRKLRLSRVECAQVPVSVPLKIYASVFDGAGMQSIYFIRQRKKKFYLSGVLLNQGQGIRTAWIGGIFNRKEINAEIKTMIKSHSCLAVNLDFINHLISHFLWVGLESGNVPPAELLLVTEAVGIADLQPGKLNLQQTADRLAIEAQLPMIDQDDLTEILDKSVYWNVDQRTGLGSWFEDDADVDELVEKNLLDSPDAASRGLLRDLLLAEILEPKREIWKERLLLMTLWAKNLIKPELYPIPWDDFLVVAGELDKNYDLNKIPLMTAIADRSVLAAQRRLRERKIR